MCQVILSKDATRTVVWASWCQGVYAAQGTAYWAMESWPRILGYTSQSGMPNFLRPGCMGNQVAAREIQRQEGLDTA